MLNNNLKKGKMSGGKYETGHDFMEQKWKIWVPNGIRAYYLPKN